MTSAKTESTSIATVLAAPIPAIEDDESFIKLIIYLFILVIAPQLTSKLKIIKILLGLLMIL
jgi:hypothetical protein